MLKVEVQLGENRLAVEGDVAFDQVRPVVDRFFDFHQRDVAAQIELARAALAAENDRLTQLVPQAPAGGEA